jgi:apolipoprotein N-acyltransferase
MERWARSDWALPALSGVLAFAAYFLPLLVPSFVAFIPLLYRLDAGGAGGWRRIKIGLVFGVTGYLLGLHFIFALLRFSWLAALLYVGFVLAEGAKLSLIVALAGWLRQRTALSWGLLLPVTWLPVEWLQTFGDLRMTGDHIANALSSYPFLIQFADLLGHYGVSLFVLAVNGLVYEALLRRSAPEGRRATLALAALLVLVLGYDLWAWNRSEEEGGRTLRVGVVQPNVDFEIKWDDEKANDQWLRLSDSSRRAREEGAELIVWPESARPWRIVHWLDVPQTYAMPETQQLARELGAALLVGVEYYRARTREDFELYNAALAVGADGEMIESWVGKVYLVPFAEATPFRALLGPLVEGKGGEWDWMAGGFTPADDVGVLDVAGARVGALVCFEQLFPELPRRLRNRGAELQVVITNDAWFGRTLFQQYQADALRLRAIENRTAFVRAANTGISGFVDRRGRYHRATSLYEETVVVHDVRLSSERTVYDRMGDGVVWLVLIGLGWAFLLALRG